MVHDVQNRLLARKSPLCTREDARILVADLIPIAQEMVHPPSRRRLGNPKYLFDLLAGTGAPEPWDVRLLASMLDELEERYALPSVIKADDLLAEMRGLDELGGEQVEGLCKELDRVQRRIDRELSGLESD